MINAIGTEISFDKIQYPILIKFSTTWNRQELPQPYKFHL